MKEQLQLDSVSVLARDPFLDSPIDATWNIGDKAVIYGPSRTGRTSLLLAIGGFLKPARGTVALQDSYTCWAPTPWDVGVGPIAGLAPLFPTLTLEEHLSVQARSHWVRHPRRRVEFSLHQWGLFPYRKRRVKDVDRHLQLRAGIALATLHQPRIVLLDEPETGLTDDQWDILREQLNQERKRQPFLLCMTSLRRESVNRADHVIHTGHRKENGTWAPG
ncbi:ABC transporter ATP-binding protein [Paludifilum halophilum]|uniref:ABC transporter domain-containing protein n=1 Tax=Paludifilum halophilum TaxID=1642702 RepID=A0A235B1L1_9BACL|nr:ATP-binding cassette domain-containing protein [Paludifilum halophilum]OYD06164.1 hypothetical protein CHM34_17605 [Paludifilum halophilum]